MARALVLNATFEPISVVPARRAVVLVLSGRAEMVHESGAVMRSASFEIDVPSVIRLRKYVRVPYPRRNAITRRGVFARDNGRCQYCDARAESIDHIHPRSRGGRHSWENVVAACRPCNSAKRDRLLKNTSMRLRRQPKTPGRTAWVRASVGRVPEPWRPYLDEFATAVPSAS